VVGTKLGTFGCEYATGCATGEGRMTLIDEPSEIVRQAEEGASARSGTR
jgi:hypothetical protein